MASTRISGDAIRQTMDNQIQTYAGRYMLNVPGNGVNMPFREDVFCRMSKFGANIHRDMMSIENHLRGQDRILVKKDPFVSTAPPTADISHQKHYPTLQPFTDQSRATAPAWIVRNAPAREHWQLNVIDDPRNPQFHTDVEFERHTGTRILEKEKFVQSGYPFPGPLYSTVLPGTSPTPLPPLP